MTKCGEAATKRGGAMTKEADKEADQDADKCGVMLTEVLRNAGQR
jgi:hypothetical protein